MRRAAKVDANQPEIVEAFRSAGCHVAHTHTLGQGFPDLIVKGKTRMVMVEVKDGSKPPSAQALTPDELEFAEKWDGHYYVVRSVDDVQTLARFL